MYGSVLCEELHQWAQDFDEGRYAGKSDMTELRLLSLDGGGVRGLSALMILEQLMEAVNPQSPPKPCEFFDMIGGTNTGG